MIGETKMTIDEVLAMVKERYLYAIKQKWIFKPLAWALYQTWKEIDRAERKENA